MAQINIKKSSSFGIPVEGTKALGFDNLGRLCIIDESGNSNPIPLENENGYVNIIANLGIGPEEDLPLEASINDIYVTNDTLKIYTRIDDASWGIKDIEESQMITSLVPLELFQLIDGVITSLTTTEIKPVKALQYDTEYIPVDPETKGRKTWNEHDFTTQTGTGFSTTQDNQEQSIPVINLTGADIPEGVYVRISGYDDSTKYDKVDLSDNSSEATAYIDGMTTCIIPSGEARLITKNGKVRGLDTHLGTPSAISYLGKNGLPTPIEPTYPDKVVIGGIYSKISNTDGEITVDINRSYQHKINKIDLEIEIRGYQNPGVCSKCPIYAEDISIDLDNKILTIITVKGGQAITPSNPLRFFTDGGGEIKKWEFTSQLSFPAWTNTNGEWYFYINNVGAPVTSQTRWTSFESIALVYSFIWNGTLSGADRIPEMLIEMHPNDMSAADHAAWHNEGAKYRKGFDLVANPISSGAPNADGRNTCLSLTTGTVADDNMPYTVTNGVGSSIWEQDMGNTTLVSLTSSNSGLFPIIKQDSSGYLSTIQATRFPFAWDTSTNRPEYISATGVRNLVTDDYYFVYYMYSIQDPRNGRQVKLVSATIQFANITDARAHTFETVKTYYPNLQNNEAKQLYKLIFLFNNSGGAYGVACKYTKLYETIDLRKQATTLSNSGSLGSVLSTNVISTPFDDITGTNSQSQVQQINDKINTNKQTIENLYAKQTVTSASGTVNIDGTSYKSFDISMAGDCTFNFSAFKINIGYVIIPSGAHAITSITASGVTFNPITVDEYVSGKSRIHVYFTSSTSADYFYLNID